LIDRSARSKVGEVLRGPDVRLRRGGGSVPNGGWNAGYLSGHGLLSCQKNATNSRLSFLSAFPSKFQRWYRNGYKQERAITRATLHTFVCERLKCLARCRAKSGPVPAPKHFKMVPSSPPWGKWWCGRGDLNPHDRLGSTDFHTTSAFAAP
jgi:hypothetical protein